MKTAVLSVLLAVLAVLGAARASYGAPADIHITSRPELGEYSFAYRGDVASAHESRAGAVTRGSFSYLDANGQVQSRSYVSDGARGFVVTASDVPQAQQDVVRDTPEVAQARAEHLAAVARAKALASSEYSPQPVEDTPEVAAARQRHLATVQAVRSGSGAGVFSQWSTPAPVFRTWSPTGDSAPTQDTVEVAAAKAKHLAAVEEAKARVSTYVPPQARNFAPVWAATPTAAASNPPAPVQDTVEVAVARAQHLAAVAEANSRAAGLQSSSIASQYVPPAASAKSTYHYPNVPEQFPRSAVTPGVIELRFSPTPAPAVHAAAPRWEGEYNAVSSEGSYVPDDEGRYIPSHNDEGQYNARQTDEGQYDPRQTDEGQYDPRQNDEGQYNPRLNDEGQWFPSQNEGQYIPGGEDQPLEDNMPYSYSYSDGLTSKSETKTPDGITRGRYSYLDANGVLQSLTYEADNVHGFRASGTNLPRAPEDQSQPQSYGTPAPYLARVPAAAVAAAYAAPASPYRAPAAPYRAPVAAYRAPVAAYHAPAAAYPKPFAAHPKPVAVYHPAPTPSYPAPVAAYAAPVASPSTSLLAPVAPADTPEVAAAKAAHFAAHREAGARLASAYSG